MKRRAVGFAGLQAGVLMFGTVDMSGNRQLVDGPIGRMVVDSVGHIHPGCISAPGAWMGRGPNTISSRSSSAISSACAYVKPARATAASNVLRTMLVSLCPEETIWMGAGTCVYCWPVFLVV